MTLSTRRRRDQARCRAARVWLNGVEVTALCFYADARRGVVRLYRRNAEGKMFTDPITKDRVATEERRGAVRFGRWAA